MVKKVSNGPLKRAFKTKALYSTTGQLCTALIDTNGLFTQSVNIVFPMEFSIVYESIHTER